MKKALVTGATGFIGSFLVRELVRQQVEVIAVVREKASNLKRLEHLPIRIVECDMHNYSILHEQIMEKDIDAVFHTAWQGISDRDAKNQEIQLQNLKHTLTLIDEADKMNIGTFIGCGSIHEYESIVEMSEDKTVSNMGYMYKAAKLSAHWMGKAKCGFYGIRFFWPFINTYGEEERSERLINMVIRSIYHCQSPDLSQGMQYYDFVHVRDVARALILIAEKGVDGTNYTIGSGEAKRLKEFLSEVGEIANRLNGNTNIALGFGKVESNVISLPKDVFDITKLQTDTGYFPQISFTEGIESTALWIKENMW